MKLSTAIIAGFALLGAASAASAAIITVSEAYDYGTYGGYDQVTFEISTPVALTDLNVSGYDFGAVGPGAYYWHGGDPYEYGYTTADVYAAIGANTASGSFADIYGDADYQTGMTQVGTLTINSGVPEPTTWALMLLGVGGVGFAMRSSRKAVLAA